MIPDDPELPPASSPTSLAPLERTVVALGLRDRLWSVPPPPRLEGLRRIVVLLSHGLTINADTESMLTVGFSPGQIQSARALSGFAAGA